MPPPCRASLLAPASALGNLRPATLFLSLFFFLDCFLVFFLPSPSLLILALPILLFSLLDVFPHQIPSFCTLSFPCRLQLSYIHSNSMPAACNYRTHIEHSTQLLIGRIIGSLVNAGLRHHSALQSQSNSAKQSRWWRSSSRAPRKQHRSSEMQLARVQPYSTLLLWFTRCGV